MRTQTQTGGAVMDEQKPPTSQGLARRTDAEALERVEELASELIRTPLELTKRVRAMAEYAHVLSPAIAVSSIAPQHVVNTAVVVIDTKLPPVSYGSAAGNDVYFQASIHKGKNRKVGDEWQTEVDEVSLNKNGLIKILSAAGVDVTRSVRTDNGSRPYYWSWCVEGTIVDFDGRKRSLPPGNVEIDYTDGAASIGEWTPAEWAKRVAEAEAKKAAAKDDRTAKIIKPEPINGWSEERVRNARRFGLRIAEAEAMNRLIRNLGIKQKYTLAELQKPFVLFRCSFQPDMSNPEIARMVTAANLGATNLLFPGTAPAVTAADDYIDVQSSSPATGSDRQSESHQPAAASEPARERTAATPSDALPFDDFPEAPPQEPSTPTFLLVSAAKLAIEGVDHFFFDSEGGPTFVTDDVSAARAMNDARKATRRLPLESERVELLGKSYQRVLDIPAGQVLPDLGKL